jgi:hypothetical protein
MGNFWRRKSEENVDTTKWAKRVEVFRVNSVVPVGSRRSLKRWNLDIHRQQYKIKIHSNCIIHYYYYYVRFVEKIRRNYQL